MSSDELSLFSYEILGLVGSPLSLSVNVQTKNVEDTSWASAGSFASITTAGVKGVDITGLREEVRPELTVAANNDWEGFYLLVAAPAWRPN